MPKKIDPAVKERAVKLVLEHQAEYPSLFAAITAVAKQQRLGTESLRRWVNQSLVDGGDRRGATTEELAEIKELKTKVRRLEEKLEIATKASIFFAGELCATRRREYRGRVRDPVRLVVAATG